MKTKSLSTLFTLLSLSLLLMNGCQSSSSTPDGGNTPVPDDLTCEDEGTTCAYSLASLDYFKNNTDTNPTFTLTSSDLKSNSDLSFIHGSVINPYVLGGSNTNVTFRIKSQNSNRYYYVTETGGYQSINQIVSNSAGGYINIHKDTDEWVFIATQDVKATTHTSADALLFDKYPMSFMLDTKGYLDESNTPIARKGLTTCVSSTNVTGSSSQTDKTYDADTGIVTYKLNTDNTGKPSDGNYPACLLSEDDNEWDFGTKGYFKLTIKKDKTTSKGTETTSTTVFITGNAPADAPEDARVYTDMADDFFTDLKSLVGSDLDSQLKIIDKDDPLS